GQVPGQPGVVITPRSNLEYLAKYRAMLSERLTALVSGPATSWKLLVPQIEEAAARAATADLDVTVVSLPEGQLVFGILAEQLAGVDQLFVDDEMSAWRLFRIADELAFSALAHFQPVTKLITPMRQIKSPVE